MCPEESESNVSVIPIKTWMGLELKTTLARFVYTNERVKHFDPKIWISVFDEFDVVKITNSIVKGVSPHVSAPSDKLDQLQR